MHNEDCTFLFPVLTAYLSANQGVVIWKGVAIRLNTVRVVQVCVDGRWEPQLWNLPEFSYKDGSADKLSDPMATDKRIPLARIVDNEEILFPETELVSRQEVLIPFIRPILKEQEVQSD